MQMSSILLPTPVVTDLGRATQTIAEMSHRTDPSTHLNFCRYQPPPDPPAAKHRIARLAHYLSDPPLTYEALRKRPFYTLTRYHNASTLDKIVIGEATMVGSHHAAYAREIIEADEAFAHYDVPKASQYAAILEHERPTSHDYAIERWNPRTRRMIRVNAYFAAACHARYIDEALEEMDENCRFQVVNNRIAVIATRRIQPGEQLLTRYGHEYWLHRALKLPFTLVQQMFNKYSPTLKVTDPAAMSQWRAILDLR